MQVFQIWKTSWTTYLLVVWKSSGLLGSLLTKSSGLPGSRLDFQEVVWTSRKSSGLPGSRLDFQEVVWTSRKSSELHGSLLTKFFRSGFNMQVFQIWKTSGTTYLLVVWKSSGSRLEVVWTSWKSSDKVVWTSCKVIWTSCKVAWKSSELPKSLLTKSSELLGSRLDFLEVIWTS
ncbi:hypothetical protein YC2023_058966 [Brassica napus]